MSSVVESGQRLRPHPEERFSSPQIEIDLGKLAGQLRCEPHAGEAGHRQETVYKGDGMTVALFVFGRFAGLAAHRADGIVSMHVLHGQVKITADGKVHELHDGQMLVLAPAVEHTVRAEDESEMLVTVHRIGGA